MKIKGYEVKFWTVRKILRRDNSWHHKEYGMRDDYVQKWDIQELRLHGEVLIQAYDYFSRKMIEVPLPDIEQQIREEVEFDLEKRVKREEREKSGVAPFSKSGF
jgi:hypothetical protein